jgi:hypothetical protein
MEQTTKTTTNNLTNQFTTTTTNNMEQTLTTSNAVELSPAQQIEKLEQEIKNYDAAYSSTLHDVTKAQQEITLLRGSIDTANVVSLSKTQTISNAVDVLIKQLDSFDIADIINSLSNEKISDIIRGLTNMNWKQVKQGIEKSAYSNEFNNEIDDLNSYISDAYNEDEIVLLIDDKYSWHTLLHIANRRGSIDGSDLIDFVDANEIATEEISNGNISFDDIMEHFDSSDCFEWLKDNRTIYWSDVKDYVDMDDVKADIKIDDDMVTEYISNLNDGQFRNLISNLS